MSNADFLEYANLISRLKLAETACKIDQARLADISFGWTKALASCKGGDNCRNLISVRAAGVAQDLAAGLHGGTCTYLADAQAQLNQADATESAWATYNKCVHAKIITLDDGTSPADVIARGVFAQCRGQAPVPDTYTPGQNVFDTLTGAILEQRRLRRSTPTKAKPASKFEG